MANPEHLAVLKKGVEEWNRWRRERPTIFPDLAEASLASLDLTSINLDSTSLIGADLADTSLTSADLTLARLQCARLEGANFRGALLRQSDLEMARWEGASFGGLMTPGTVFSLANLNNAQGLEACHFLGPSSIDMPTIVKSWPLPTSFLQGCGLPDEYIQWLLKHLPLKVPSCFISYSNVDSQFGQCVYADLQSRGVRCWFFPENARWGGHVWGEIGKGIEDYERTLVICSEASLKSGPVIREIERALKKEDRTGRHVLFPITLDGFLFEQWEHDRKPDVVAKVVGDFTDWKDPASYKKAFERLLSDLKHS